MTLRSAAARLMGSAFIAFLGGVLIGMATLDNPALQALLKTCVLFSGVVGILAAVLWIWTER
jgi:ABC-type nitrate/sulfonate/bicarbonate transport system permease component